MTSAAPVLCRSVAHLLACSMTLVTLCSACRTHGGLLEHQPLRESQTGGEANAALPSDVLSEAKRTIEEAKWVHADRLDGGLHLSDYAVTKRTKWVGDDLVVIFHFSTSRVKGYGFPRNFSIVAAPGKDIQVVHGR